MVQTRLLSFTLVMVGILIVAQQTGIITALAFRSWYFLLLLLGLFAMLLSIAKQNGLLSLISGIFTAIALFMWGQNHIANWPNHWSILLLLIGAGILFRCSIDREHRSILIGTTCALCGFCAWPKLYQLPGFSTLGPILNTYWAVLIILLGFLILKRR